MCAEYERVERVVQNDVWAEESAEGVAFNPMNPQPDESRMVKKFRRAAAGLEEQLPSDLRPPAVLVRTCDYLFDEVICNAPALEKVHHFVWDRTRAIRNDFSIQQVTRAEDLRMAVECYERIARFHIMSLHLLAGAERPYDKYDAQQEREQLDRTLLSLMQYYDDSRGRLQLPNEAEFRAYCVIFQLQDPIPDLEDRAQSWPRHIITDKRVRAALELYAAACNTADAQGPLRPRTAHLIAQQDFHRFWTLVESPRISYLMACVAEIYFNMVRRMTLNALHRAFRQSATRNVEDWTVSDLLELLAFDDEDQLETFCKAHGFSFGTTADGTPFLDLLSVKGDLPQTDASCPKQWKSELVEDKRYYRTVSAIINGNTVSQARANGQVTEEEMEMDEANGEAEDVVATETQQLRKGPFMEGEEDNAADDGDSLFLPQSKETSESKGGVFGMQPIVNGTSTSGGFTFGKPSNSAFGQPSAPSQPSTTSAAGNIFGKSSSAFGQAAPATHNVFGGSVFGKPSTTPEAPAIEAPKKMLFDFAPKPAEAAAAQGPLDFLSKPKEDPSPPATFPPTSEQVSHSASVPPFTPDSFSLKPPSAATTGEEPTSQSAVSAAAFSNQQTSPAFLWSLPQAAAPSTAQSGAEKQNSPFSTQPKVPVEPNPAEKLFTFGAPSNAEGATSLNEPVSKTETPAQSQVNYPATAPSKQSQRPGTSPAPSLSPERRVSLVKDTKPRISSPLVNSYLPEEPPSAFAPPGPSLQALAPKATAAEIFTRLADELFGSEHSGFLEQFITYTVQEVVSSVHNGVVSERENAKADRFREEVLLHRYGKRWRETLWRKKSAARASQRRERARQGLNALKSSRDSDMGSIFSSRRGPSMGRHDGNSERACEPWSRQSVITSQSAEQQAVLGSKRPLSAHGHDPASTRDRSHKRQKSSSHVDDHGCVIKPATASGPHADLLRRSAYLGGPSVGATPPARSTTQSSYFRLKALGIGGSDGLSESRGTKRSRDDSLGFKMRDGSLALTASKRSTPEFLRSQSSEMPPPPAPRTNDLDEELFARLKRARESLAEGSEFMRASVARETELRRSLSASVSSNDSPSMAKARAEARWRALQRDSLAAQLDIPAYRLRESKFVPREDYGKAIERAKELRASRSRGTSRPESRLGQSDNGSPSGNGKCENTRSPDQPPRFGSPVLPTASVPNGTQFTSLPQWQPPVAQSASGPSASAKSQEGPSWATTNAATLFGMQRQGFGTLQNQSSGFGFSGFTPTAGSNGTFAQASNNFTLQPPQIEQSLSNSFGQPAMPSQRMTSQQDDLESQTFHDYTQDTSGAISVISGDEEEQAQQPSYAHQFARPGSFTQPAQDTEGDDLLDDREDEEVPDPYQHTNNCSSNPFAVLSGEYGEDTEENTELDQSEDESSLQGRGFYAQRGSQGTQLHNGHYENSSAASLEDEESGDGDTEDVDGTEDEDEGEQGYDEDEGEEDYDEDLVDGEDYDEDAPPRRPSSGLFRYVNGNLAGHSGEQSDLHGNPFPAKNPDLQDVGATEEEAIELSD